MMTQVVPSSPQLLVCDGGSVYETSPIQKSPERHWEQPSHTELTFYFMLIFYMKEQQEAETGLQRRGFILLASKQEGAASFLELSGGEREELLS